MARLVGRTREFTYLTSMIEATAAGQGGCAVLTGQPGIGKTTLLHDVIEVARASGLAVAPGAASELDRVRPLTTLADALRASGPEPVDLARLSDQGSDRVWYLDRLAEALEDYVAERGLVVVIDDAQWTDEFSALALRVLVPALAHSPVRWLLARRPVPADSAAQVAIEWLLNHEAEQIMLGPLDDASVRQLCSDVLAAEPDATVLTLTARGGGNPFLVRQLLDTMLASGQVVVGDGVATVVGDELPSGFLAAVRQRLRGLSPQARRLLQAGAVFGRPFTLHASAQVTGIGRAELHSAAEEVLAAGILVERDGRMSFSHDLLREAIYNDASGPVRAAMHREVATILRAAEHHSPVELAEHLVRSGERGDREAVGVLHEAATQLAGRAPGTAADYIVRAVAMLGEHDPDRARLAAVAVGLLSSAGRLEQALKLGDDALHGGMAAGTEATLLLGLADALKHAGQNQDAVGYARRALALPAVPDPVRAKLHAVAAHALLYVDDMPGADRAGAEAAQLGTAVGEYSAAVFGSTARAVVARAQGRLDDALAHAQHAVEVADQAGGEAVHRHPRVWLGSALAALDRFAEAEQTYRDGRSEAERLGTGWSYPLWHHYLAYLHTAQGRLDEAVAEAEAGLAMGDRLAAKQLNVPILALLARVALLRGEPGLAHEHVREMKRLQATGITSTPEDVDWTVALCHDADGSPQLAVRDLADIYRRLPERLLMFCNDPASAPALVRIALAAGDTSRAEAAAAAAGLLAKHNPSVGSLAACAAHATGLLHRDRAALRRAVDLFHDSPRRLARASAVEDAAEAERTTGNRARAVALLEQALDESTACGAHRAVARLERRLRSLGRRHSTVPQQRRGESPLDRLTEAERKVGRLVAQGRTNRAVAEQLFLSRHTVDSHLRSIFGKLGIRSRVELARIWPH